MKQFAWSRFGLIVVKIFYRNVSEDGRADTCCWRRERPRAEAENAKKQAYNWRLITMTFAHFKNKKMKPRNNVCLRLLQWCKKSLLYLQNRQRYHWKKLGSLLAPMSKRLNFLTCRNGPLTTLGGIRYNKMLGVSCAGDVANLFNTMFIVVFLHQAT